MMEAFLVNPKSQRRRTTTTSRVHRRRTGTARRKRHGLPSQLLRRMMKTYGPQQGMKRAWSEFRKGITRNPWPDDARGHRKAALKGIRRRRRTVSRRHRKNPWESIHYRPRTTRLWRSGSSGRFGRKIGQRNPFGEEVLIVGNRRRKRRSRRSSLSSLFGNRRRRVRRHRGSYGLNPRRRHYRRHRRSYAMNPRRRYRRRYSMNPRRRYRRRYSMNPRRRRHFRRNPAAAGLPAISFKNPMSILMPAAFGTAGFMAAEYLPAKFTMLGTSTYARLGLKAGVAFGGAMLLSRFTGRKNGVFFAVGAGISLFTDIVRTFILKTTTVAGYGAFPYQISGYEGVGAFPGEMHGVDGFGAYPYQGSGYPM